MALTAIILSIVAVAGSLANVLYARHNALKAEAHLREAREGAPPQTRP